MWDGGWGKGDCGGLRGTAGPAGVPGAQNHVIPSEARDLGSWRFPTNLGEAVHSANSRVAMTDGASL